jgi:metallothionein
MSTETQSKCAHPACSCPIAKSDKFCSQSCKEAAEITEIACQCGHPGCAGESLRATSVSG